MTKCFRVIGPLFLYVLLEGIQILATQSTFEDSVSHHPRSLPPQPNPSIRALFQLQPGERSVYPAIDKHGARPKPAWLAAYKRAKAAGLIPSIPLTQVIDGIPAYPAWYKGNPCSFSINKCNATDDINSIPPRIALNPLLTTLTDEEVVAELGWVMQVMYDLTGGKKLCKYWRPPSGEMDDRIRAIARSVFNLTAVTWTDDPDDWCLSNGVPNGSVCSPGNGPQSLAELEMKLYNYINTPRSKGIMVLHHEQTTRGIMAYEYMYAFLKHWGWSIRAVPEVWGLPWYQ
ncbi:hypothetical protein CROQUDRAFT_657299 [Cronartium quercuum f. sp. fusiforme G11]|uniref:Chitin deacetylase n=1 Tax=Cronartium quercuum f. sp. fusiforme G11 TaxID=708437 RepID=A0A9P6NN33_9BASI|nr:hypothetical protein CROQUDRAFT_657299 [Cronartium quercuum f. sp. fusiforme G11]